jgi:hypothetical protein
MLLTTIAQTGRLAVPHPADDPPDLVAQLESDLLSHEADRRLELLHPAPAFDLATGMHASRLLYRACQFLIYRDLGDDAVAGGLGEPFAGPMTPAACYSADIAFAALPDLFALARGASPADPLVQGLQQLARAWPLSSVGIPGVGDVDVSPFIDDPALCDLYIDRVVRHKDKARARDPRVAAALRAAAGAYDDLTAGLLPAQPPEVTA